MSYLQPIKKNLDYYEGERLDVRDFIKKHIKFDLNKVLEIWCGVGNFSKLLKCNSWIGIEPNTEAANQAKNKGLEVINSTYEEYSNQLSSNYFDLVICNDVIEHMPSHDFFLKDSLRILKTKGAIIGSVPNVLHMSVLYELLVSKEWIYQPYGIKDNTHLRWFTNSSIVRSLKEAGYNNINSEMYNNLVSLSKNRLKVKFIKWMLPTIGFSESLYQQIFFVGYKV